MCFFLAFKQSERDASSPMRTETICCRWFVKRSARNVTQSHKHGHGMPVRHSCASVSGRLQNSCVSTREQKKAVARFPRLQLARSFRARFSQTHHYSPTSWISYFIKWMFDLDPLPHVCGLLINKGSETESRAVCNLSIQNVNYWEKKPQYTIKPSHLLLLLTELLNSCPHANLCG